jgi:hypothetical protein
MWRELRCADLVTGCNFIAQGGDDSEVCLGWSAAQACASRSRGVGGLGAPLSTCEAGVASTLLALLFPEPFRPVLFAGDSS